MFQKRQFATVHAKRVAASLIKPLSASEKVSAASLPKVELWEEQLNYLQTIAEGWAFPLKRFMNEQELIESMNMRTVTCENGNKHILSVPITQHITSE
jgi:ATP sulfurylase